MNHSLNILYRLIGTTKQAVHQQRKRALIFEAKLAELMIQVDVLRSDHPGCGVEKMYSSLRPNFIGRDRFVNILMTSGYRVCQKKNYTKTTFPVCSNYENLIQGLLVRSINQVVQTDICYFLIGNTHYYLVFIIDVYSKRIVGHKASNHMRAQANRDALKQMIKLRGKEHLKGMIHHSDKGRQFHEKAYIGMLESIGCHISMGSKAQDNAYAERINGIIKNEYLYHWNIETLSKLKKMLDKAVQHYNCSRPHKHLPDRMTPVKFESELNKQQIHHFELIYAEQNYRKRPHQFNLAPEITKNTGYFCPI